MATVAKKPTAKPAAAAAKKPAAKAAVAAKKPTVAVKATKPVAAAKKPAAKPAVTKPAAAKVAVKSAPAAKKSPAKPVSVTKAPAAKAAVVAKKPVGKPVPAAKTASSKVVAKPAASAASKKPVAKPAVPASAVKKTAQPMPVSTKTATPKTAPSKAAPAAAKKPAAKKGASGLLTEAELLKMSDKDYMNDAQQAFFRAMLQSMKDEILDNARETGEHLKENEVFADPNDRATVEEENMLEQRVRDRERKLLKKIDSALRRLDAGEYGFCLETGEPIGVGRLLARPTAELSIEAQEKHERMEKLFAD